MATLLTFSKKIKVTYGQEAWVVQYGVYACVCEGMHVCVTYRHVMQRSEERVGTTLYGAPSYLLGQGVWLAVALSASSCLHPLQLRARTVKLSS